MSMTADLSWRRFLTCVSVAGFLRNPHVERQSAPLADNASPHEPTHRSAPVMKRCTKVQQQHMLIWRPLQIGWRVHSLISDSRQREPRCVCAGRMVARLFTAYRQHRKPLPL